MTIYCTGCSNYIEARLTDGKEIYPHRMDLATLPFWKCDGCGNYVGCHHKTDNPTRPLGVIPTPELKAARQQIHAILDPLWQSGEWGRRTLYAELTNRLGWKYHTASIESMKQAREVYQVVKQLKVAPTGDADQKEESNNE